MEDTAFTTLETERLVVRRFHAGDAELFAAYRNDPDVARYQGWQLPYAARDAAEFITRLAPLSPGVPGTWFQFAVVHALSARMIGDIALRTTFEDPLHAEIGFSFAATSQGHGYASEAVRAVIEYAFTILDMRRIFAIIDSRNDRAHKLLVRLSFQLEQKIDPLILLYSQFSRKHAAQQSAAADTS